MSNDYFLHISDVSKDDTTDVASRDILIVAVACLGGLILVVLVLILVGFALKKNRKPPHRNSDSPEARERMIEAQRPTNMGQNVPLQPEYYPPQWVTLPPNPKMGLPLPPTPMEAQDLSLNTTMASRNGQINQHFRHYHPHHQHFRR